MPNQHTKYPQTREQRFWSKVDPCRTDGCMVWVGKKVDGYGRFSVGEKEIRAHQFLAGKASEGLEWDHLCRNRACVNPDHLEAVTTRVNVLRGLGFAAVNTRKIQCPRGHPYDETNTLLYQGRRYCRTCHLAAAKARYQAGRQSRLNLGSGVRPRLVGRGE